MRAPYVGGLLISLRCSTESWLVTRAAVSCVGDTTWSAPTRSPYRPAFLAKLCNQRINKDTTPSGATYLTDQKGHAPSDKLPDSPGVSFQVSACEALVGAVEECVMALLEHDIGDLRPLFLCRVDTGGVMCTGMKQVDRTRRSSVQGRDETVVIQSNGSRIIVGVGFGCYTNILKNGVVIDWMRYEI